MAQAEERLPSGWRTSWPTAEEIAEHDRRSYRGWWLARCTLQGLDGLLFVGFFDEERQFTIATPALEPTDPVETYTTTVAPGWSFCPIDEWALDAPRDQAGAEPVLIWSDKHEAWWRADGMGYTKVRAEAGIYTRQDAARRTGAGYQGQLVGLRDSFTERSARSGDRRGGSHAHR